MREGRAIVQGMIDCDLPIVTAINGAAVSNKGRNNRVLMSFQYGF